MSTQDNETPAAQQAEYRNLWHTSRSTDPAFYRTSAKPVAYGGFLIYHRLQSSSPSGNCWDIVRDGVAVGQYAGLSGAKGAIDGLAGTEYSRLRENMERAFPSEVAA